jgi:hypothetical protein
MRARALYTPAGQLVIRPLPSDKKERSYEIRAEANPAASSGRRRPPVAYRLLRGKDLNLRPRGYEPRELPDCSTPRLERP